VVPGVLKLVADAEWAGVVVGDGEVEERVIREGVDGWGLLAVFVDVLPNIKKMMKEGLIDECFGGFPCEFQIEIDKEFFPPRELDDAEGVWEHGCVEKFLIEVFANEYIGLDVVDGESVVVDFVENVHGASLNNK
jgi:hypothetical protein